MDETNYIRDENSPLANSTLIPNIIDDMALSVYAVRLYLRLKRRVNQNKDGSTNGVATESTLNLAETCGMSTAQVSRSKQELLKAGLIRIKEVPCEHGKSHEITIIDIWEANKVYYAKTGLALTKSTGETITGKEARAAIRANINLRSQIPEFIRTITDTKA